MAKILIVSECASLAELCAASIRQSGLHEVLTAYSMQLAQNLLPLRFDILVIFLSEERQRSFNEAVNLAKQVYEQGKKVIFVTVNPSETARWLKSALWSFKNSNGGGNILILDLSHGFAYVTVSIGNFCRCYD